MSDKPTIEQFSVESEELNLHFDVSFHHFTTPSVELIQTFFRKRRKGTRCHILISGVYDTTIRETGTAFLNPNDLCGFVFTIGRKVAFSRAVHYIEDREIRSILWDAFLQFNQ